MSKVIVVPDLIDILPFHKGMSWEKFQVFCTDLLYKKFDCVDTREYLKKGNSQKGIDVYSIKRGEKKLSVAQCKLYEYLGPQQVWYAIDDFLKNEDLVKETVEFIFCTSADLSRQQDEEHTITVSRQKLAAHGIDFIVWDERGLSKELRTTDSPEIINIVYRNFGEEVALNFYGQKWREYINTLRPVKKPSYTASEDHIERNITPYYKRPSATTTQSGLTDLFDEKRETLIEVFENKSGNNPVRIVLLSIAGFGKTEEIKNIAAYFSSENRINFAVKFILADYEGQSVDTLLSSIDVNWRNIKQEYLLLLFDGLDELTEGYYQSFIKQVNAFVEQNPLVQIVISSRYNFYDVNHPPLRSFDIYLLHSLSNEDIQKYIGKKLESQKEGFIQKLHECKFDEYISNPYYLTRLVRFYNTPGTDFPKNKSKLFERILFEQLDKDQNRYNISELKEKLYPVAKQIAFCMTLSGKSILSDSELKLILPNSETRKLLNHFSVFNRNVKSQNTWSFEHKNLQEFLAAQVFARCTFTQIHEIISFEFDRTKLLPKFLNTVSFLFEIIDRSSAIFQDLFLWVNENNKELFVRFEREQLSTQIRHEIFYRIFSYYRDKDITMRVSLNFSYEELALFLELDNSILEFLRKEFERGTPAELAYDLLYIISFTKRPFRFKTKILELLYFILRERTYPEFIQAKAINVLTSLQFTDVDIFQNALNSGADLCNEEIRKACLYFLENTNYFEEYSQFILKSIPILEQWAKGTNSFGHLLTAKRLLLKFSDPKKIREIFQFGLLSKNSFFERHSLSNEFHFEHDEVKRLLSTGIEVYKIDKSILPLVYRLFFKMEYISQDQHWFLPFRTFFEQTCGTHVIFKKIYKYGKHSRDIMSFADSACIDILIDEYKNAKLSDQEMIVYRNQLSWLKNELFSQFHDKLLALNPDTFLIDDIDVDYYALKEAQELRNQEMLLDRSLFFKEAELIFDIVNKDKITIHDLRATQTPGLRNYQNSIVIESIRKMCVSNDEKMITKEHFFTNYNDQVNWNRFAVSTINNLLDNKNRSVDSRLLIFLSDWCKSQIETLDFENSVRDFPDGDRFTYNPDVEFTKNVFLKLNLDLNDKLLLKMLPSVLDSFYGWRSDSERTLSSIIVEKTKDKELLKSVVLHNITNNGLSLSALLTHFAICHKLLYKECLPFLFDFTISNLFLKDYQRVNLTKYYLDLGGEINDFVEYLQIPDKSSDDSKYAAWHWFLIEKLLFIAPEKASDILFQILKDSYKWEEKLTAGKYLMKLSRIEGVEVVQLYLKETKILPYEQQWDGLQQYIVNMPPEKVINSFCWMLDFAYANGVQDRFNGPGLIQEALYGSILTIAGKEYKHFISIKNRLIAMIEAHAGKEYSKSLRFSSERFIQLYYQNKSEEIDIQKADMIYQSITAQAHE